MESNLVLCSQESTELILALACEQHGVVGRKQLLDLGFDPEMVKKRVTTKRLIPLFPGTYAVGHAQITQRGWWRAAVLTGGSCAALSHKSAAALWGILPAPGTIEILRSSSPNRPNSKLNRSGRRPALTIHRSRVFGPSEYEILDGIRVTSVARTFLDIAPRLSVRKLESALTEAERLHIVQIEPLREAAMRGKGWPGSRKLRQVLEGWDPHSLDARTDLELAFVAMCREYDVVLPELNVWVNGFLVDGFWPSKRLVVELDSQRYHRSTWQFNRDLEHTLALEEAGYRVLRLTWNMLTKDSRRTASILRRRVEGQGRGGRFT